MFLNDDEIKNGYELQWKDRDSKILTKHGKVVGVVDSREAIFMAIESHERYLEIVRINQDLEKPMSSMDKAHIAALVVFVVFIALMSSIYAPS